MTEGAVPLTETGGGMAEAASRNGRGRVPEWQRVCPGMTGQAMEPRSRAAGDFLHRRELWSASVRSITNRRAGSTEPCPPSTLLLFTAARLVVRK
jgi:hypothetical protein